MQKRKETGKISRIKKKYVGIYLYYLSATCSRIEKDDIVRLLGSNTKINKH